VGFSGTVAMVGQRYRSAGSERPRLERRTV
jgi:hypothetical protein